MNTFNKSESTRVRMLYHLFRHPLYDAVARDDIDLQIAVFGLGEYGAEFLDAALQHGQIIGKRLSVTVFSADIAYVRERYLNARPALGDFFEIEGVYGGNDDDSYGSISFAEAEFSKDNEKNIRLIDSYIDDKLDYAFVALGDDALNLSAARACMTDAAILECACTVCFPAADPEIIDAAKCEGLIPVEMDSPVENDPLYEHIERMAFNSHLAWCGCSGADINAERQHYNESYNRFSCLANVLSIKTKLFSLDIPFDETIISNSELCLETAIRFSSAVKDRLTELMWIEHRRWVVEKLCMGYVRLEVSECAYGETHNRTDKKHLCLVKSRKDRLLHERDAFWDKTNEAELNALDPLDRVSVELHRKYVKRANALTQLHPLSSDAFDAVKTLGNRGLKAAAAFKDWHNCMIDAFEGKDSAAKNYQRLKSKFCREAGNIRKDNEVIKRFEQQFLPFVERLRRLEFKEYDRVLAEIIPFIITYDADCCVIVPMKTGSNDNVLDSIASTLIINPKTLILLTDAPQSEAESAFTRVKNLINTKKLHTTARLSHTDSLHGLAEAYRNHRIVAFEENDTALCKTVVSKGVPKGTVRFTFDWRGQSFSSPRGTSRFSFIPSKTFLTAADIAGFAGATGKSIRPEFKDDYGALWNLYTENRGAWKYLCNRFNDANTNLSVSFTRKRATNEKQTYRYILSYSCYESAKTLLKELAAHGVCEPNEYRLNALNSSRSFAIEIDDRRNRKNEFDTLFANPYLLADVNAWQVYAKGEWVTAVEITNMQAESVSLDEADGAAEEWLVNACRRLIQKLSDRGFLLNPRFSGDGRGVSFYYATPDIKHLLTTAGNLFEIYLYHRLNKQREYFDDVVNSFEINWNNSYADKNEFDLIVTKGLVSVVIECKARAPQIAFYDELNKKIKGCDNAPSRCFNAHTIPVLICDAKANSHMDVIESAYEQYGIITVYKEEEIKDFFGTVKKMIEGSYIPSFQ